MKVKVLKVRLDEKFLHSDQKELDMFLSSNNILKSESAFVAEENFWSVLLYYEEIRTEVRESKTQKYVASADDTLSADEEKMMDALKLWRSEKASEQKLPVYFIATNAELFSIAKFKPIKKEELQQIKGFGRHKIENYGAEIIDILENV